MKLSKNSYFCSMSNKLSLLYLILIIATVFSACRGPEAKKNKAHTLASSVSLGHGGSSLLVFREDTNNNLETERSQPVKVGGLKRSQPVKDLTVREVCVTNMEDEKSWSIHGLIVNSSTDSTFKEVVVEITYYSEDETSLGSKTYTIPEIFSPQSKKDVALNIEPNKGDVRRIGMNVINATAN
jgi:hypothetical protein